MHMNESDKNTALIRNLTLFFGGFLLFTDVFFLSMGIIYDNYRFAHRIIEGFRGEARYRVKIVF